MILTVTLNPLLERRFLFHDVQFNNENRGGSAVLKAGGKGINVSRQLNFLNVDNTALTFLGGINGKILKEVLQKENIKNVSIHTVEETRDSAVIVDESSGNISTFFRSNSKVSLNEVDEFKEKLKKMIENCEMVIFAGSSPCVEADRIFPYGIGIANEFDKISICDTYGTHLKNCIEKSPTIIHNNISETEKSLNVSLKSEKEKIDFLNYLYDKGVKQAYLTDGENPVFASNFDYHFKLEVPKIKPIDPTGSGDSFVAGIAYAWHNALTFEEALTVASLLGAANASRFEVCNVSIEEIENLKTQIKVSPIGKIMKTLDVTPS